MYFGAESEIYRFVNLDEKVSNVCAADVETMSQL
jgi:hypothetical protein